MPNPDKTFKKPVPKVKAKFAGSSRPSPIKQQPLPAYGPYKAPLTPAEKRIVILKRSPKFVNTPAGRVATGGGGVGFYTKGNKGIIANRVMQRAIAAAPHKTITASTADNPIIPSAKKGSAVAIRPAAKPPVIVSKAHFVNQNKNVHDFGKWLDQNATPVLGDIIGGIFSTAKTPEQQAAWDKLIKEHPKFDLANMKAGVNPANRTLQTTPDANFMHLKHAISLGLSGAKDAAGYTIDNILKPSVSASKHFAAQHGAEAVHALSSIPLVQEVNNSHVKSVVDNWASNAVIHPASDFVTKKFDQITGGGLAPRLAKATPQELQVLYSSSDVGGRTSVSPELRAYWMKLALGQTSLPAWKNYKSAYSIDQLNHMSDYELVQQAYGTDLNWFESHLASLQSDLHKLGQAPAALSALQAQIDEQKRLGNSSGLGTLGIFMAKQAVNTAVAIGKADASIMTNGGVGSTEPLKRALNTEPIFTTLDAIAIASGVGKVATTTLKTAGIAARTGAIIGKVPLAARAGSIISRGAEAAAAPRIVGAPLRVAAAAGRGARKIADTSFENPVLAQDPNLAKLGGNGGVHAFSPQPNIVSQAAAHLKGALYGSDTKFGQLYRKVVLHNSAVHTRALISHLSRAVGNNRARPLIAAFKRLHKADPVSAALVQFELNHAPEIALTGRLAHLAGQDSLTVTPASEIDRLNRVLNNELWTTTHPDANGVHQFYYGTESPGPAYENVHLSTAENANVKAVQEQLQILADATPEQRTMAQEFLNQPLDAAVNGKKTGRKILVGFKGRRPQAQTVRDALIQSENQNISAISQLGVTPLSNIQSGVDLRAHFGLPPEVAGSRRIAGNEGIARVQDPTAAILAASPITDKVRAEALNYLNGQGVAAADTLAKSEATVAKVGPRLAASKEKLASFDKTKQDIVGVRARIAKDESIIAKSKDAKVRRNAAARIKTANKKVASLEAQVKKETAAARGTTQRMFEQTSQHGLASHTAEMAKQTQEAIDTSVKNIHTEVDALMRDAIESGAKLPGGGMVFRPNLGTLERNKAMGLNKGIMGGRASARDMSLVHKGQYTLYGNASDIANFGAVQVKYQRIPVMALSAVQALNRFLHSEGKVMVLSKNAEKFAEQKKLLEDLNLIQNGSSAPDYVVLVVDPKTGFIARDLQPKFDAAIPERVGAVTALNDAEHARAVAEIVRQGISESVSETLDAAKGKTILIVPKSTFNTINNELAAAAKTPNMLQKFSRVWSRVALSTLPRTPIANVLGSGALAAQGSGWRMFDGYHQALHLMETGDTPPELMHTGLAGANNPDFGIGGGWKVPGSPAVAAASRQIQHYMDWIYSYNVMGEDLARLTVFVAHVKKGMSKMDAASLQKELDSLGPLQNSMQDLLKHVANGDFNSPGALSPELLAIRDKALRASTDWLGGRIGLTSSQRKIQSIIPFWSWYSHTLKLFFYTMPVKYPGQYAFVHALASLGQESQRMNGFQDTFFSSDIALPYVGSAGNRFGVGQNIYAGQFPAQMGNTPGLTGLISGFGSAVTPVASVPLKIIGSGLAGQKIRDYQGQAVNVNDYGTLRGAEAVLASTEKLIAPLGLLQSSISPNTSVTIDMFRALTGNPIPVASSAGGATGFYAQTPRGSALGLPMAIGSGIASSLGFPISRVPTTTPSAKLQNANKRSKFRKAHGHG